MAAAAAHPVATLRQHTTALEAALTVCLARPRPRAVHNLRSATRRIEAQLHLLDLLTGMPRHRAEQRQLLRQLGRFRRAAGKVRDLDVQRRILAAAFPHSVEAAALRAKIKLQREHAAKHLLDVLARRQIKASAAIEELMEALRPAEKQALASKRLLHLIEQWYAQYSDAYARARETEETLHDIRKAAKLARYLAESAPGSAAAAAAARFERIQKAGGHWHDWLQLSKLAGIRKEGALAEHMKRRTAAHLHTFRVTLARHPKEQAEAAPAIAGKPAANTRTRAH